MRGSWNIAPLPPGPVPQQHRPAAKPSCLVLSKHPRNHAVPSKVNSRLPEWRRGGRVSLGAGGHGPPSQPLQRRTQLRAAGSALSRGQVARSAVRSRTARPPRSTLQALLSHGGLKSPPRRTVPLTFTENTCQSLELSPRFLSFDSDQGGLACLILNLLKGTCKK